MVLFRVRFGIFDHLLNFVFSQTTRSSNLDRLLLASPKVFGIDVHDTIGIDIKRHLNLWQAAWGRGDANQVKLSQQPIVGSHLTLALMDTNRDCRLVISRG